MSKLVLPIAIKDENNTQEIQNLLDMKEPCISFSMDNLAGLLGQGAYVVLDFGKEIAGGVRLLTRGVGNGPATLRITFGESLTEACSRVGEGTATNDHSPRDFTVQVSNMSDLAFGQSGFRFVRLEVVSDHTVWLRSVYAVNNLPFLKNEGKITTNDALLNQIMDAAQYTLKLTFQNGYIWDGVKRDRMVWCGDLNPEILASLYLFDNHNNIKNSLRFLRKDTKSGHWINTIPTYSAWWVINLCDYCRISGDWAFFQEQKDYALEILVMLDNAAKADGQIDFGKVESDMPFFLDWPTFQTEDAVTGTAALLCYTAKLYLQIEHNENAAAIYEKLGSYLDKPCEAKCVRAFQILAGRRHPDDAAFLEAGGAKGLSTFMAYYILKADALAGGTQMLSMLKEYYGGMLERGATTFWEDFDLDWLEGSGRIDEFPAEGQKDIHADYGNFCYKGLRHSLCHGWSAGVLAFLVEWVLGLSLSGREKKATFQHHPLGLTDIDATLPVEGGSLEISLHDGNWTVQGPEKLWVVREA